MKPEYVGLLSLVVLFGAIFIGFPIAFTLIAVALGIGYLALGDLALHLMTLQFFSVMRDPTLASVPFFLFMGYLLEQSGLMERLFRGVQLMLASLNGSLYLAVLITAIAAITGLKPKGTRHVAHTRLMGMARLVLLAIVIIFAYLAFRARSGG